MARNGPVAVLTLRVLGVDPALRGATGYGVVELEGQRARMLYAGHLRFPARASFSMRLREIHGLMERLVEEFSPHAVAVESVFTALNMRTALKLAEVRGVILLAAAEADIPTYSYSPREVKASISGFGGASKLQMQRMIQAQLGLREQPEPSDAAAALAVALCHALAAPARERQAHSKGDSASVLASRSRTAARSQTSSPRISIER